MTPQPCIGTAAQRQNPYCRILLLEYELLAQAPHGPEALFT